MEWQQMQSINNQIRKMKCKKCKHDPKKCGTDVDICVGIYDGPVKFKSKDNFK